MSEHDGTRGRAATPTPRNIRHPMWCTADDHLEAFGGHIHEDWQYDAPAEPDHEHRGRIYYADSGSTTFTVALVQPFEEFAGGLLVHEPVIGFTAYDHEVEGGTINAWLTPAEAKLLAAQIGRALTDHERGPHLPVSSEVTRRA